MKLYIEEQIEECYRRGLMDGRLNNIDYSISDGFKPIEFLSNEHFNKNLNNKINKQMKDLKTIIAEKIGEASMCWKETPKGEFDSSKASQVADDILLAIIESQEPHISILEPGSEAETLFEAAKPLMKLLNDKYHPMCTIIVNHGNVQVYEGICSTGFTNEFMND